jgi:DNA invertase Pin-like site-specific DNA recombinase
VIDLGNVYISIDDDHEAMLRRIAAERYGAKKGSISEAVMAAIDELEKKSKKERAKAKLIESMEKGYDLGFKGRAYKTRDELYD